MPSVQTLVRVVFFLNLEPWYSPWSSLAIPNLTGSVLQWNPGPARRNPTNIITATCGLFHAVILQEASDHVPHTSPISSLRTLATRTDGIVVVCRCVHCGVPHGAGGACNAQLKNLPFHVRHHLVHLKYPFVCLFWISQRILTCCGSLSPQQLHRYPPGFDATFSDEASCVALVQPWRQSQQNSC